MCWFEVDAKLDAIKASYVTSQHLNISKHLQELLQNDASLRDALVANYCSMYTLNEYCVKERMFGVAIFDDEILARTLRDLKGVDATKKFYATSEEDEDLLPHERTANAYGRSLLRMISLAFGDRLHLFKVKLCFLKVVFDAVKANVQLLERHIIELQHHMLRLHDEMEAFSKQLPTKPPTVGNFGGHSKMLNILECELEEFMFDKVDAVIKNLKAPTEANAADNETDVNNAMDMDNARAMVVDTKDADSDLTPSTPKRSKHATEESQTTVVSETFSPPTTSGPRELEARTSDELSPQKSTPAGENATDRNYPPNT